MRTGKFKWLTLGSGQARECLKRWKAPRPDAKAHQGDLLTPQQDGGLLNSKARTVVTPKQASIGQNDLERYGAVGAVEARVGVDAVKIAARLDRRHVHNSVLGDR